MNISGQTTTLLLKLWKDQDIQLMILISLMVELFLLFISNLRRRISNCLLGLMAWLTYVGTDACFFLPHWHTLTIWVQIRGSGDALPVGTVSPPSPQRRGYHHDFVHGEQQPMAEAFSQSGGPSDSYIVWHLEVLRHNCSNHNCCCLNQIWRADISALKRESRLYTHSLK